jgi:hypothetical protein
MPEILPFDIIMKILKMRPRDSQMKSPTAELIKEELLELYEVSNDDGVVRDQWAPNLFVRYFEFYERSHLCKKRRRRFRQIYNVPDSDEHSEVTDSEDDE